MKPLGLFLVSFTLLTIAPSASADIGADAKAYFETALQVYLDSGPRAFIEYSMKNGALEGNPQAISQANVLQQIQDLGGKPKSFEVSSVTKLSDRGVELLYVINLEKLPIFGNALLFQSSGGAMTVVTFNFNSAPEKVWPEHRVYGVP